MDDLWVKDAGHALGPDGPLSENIQGFEARDSQIEMAKAIEECISNKSTLIAESGTGTGKTFAYLIPAILSEKTTIVSTGTKHLQEQLFHRDIPSVLRNLEISAKVALLKGRSNYLCLHRAALARTDSRRLDRQTLEYLNIVGEWIPRTSTGDIGDLTDVPEDSRVWSAVTSTADNCIGNNCSYFEECFVNKARKKAVESDLVIINHHLFFADKALKEDGFGSLLPEVHTVIFDEAHQIPDVASNFLGSSFSSWQVMELVSDVKIAELKEKSLIKNLIPKADELDKSIADFRLGLGLDERRVAWDDLLYETPNLPKKLDGVVSLLEDFCQVLEEASVAGEGLTRCYERGLELKEACAKLSTESVDIEVVRWVEISRRTFRIHETPLDVGQELNAFFGNSTQARVFTSATLSVDGDFDHFKQLVGVGSDHKVASWESPFDYYNQAALYVPEGLPAPKDDSFADVFFDRVFPVINASEGSAFVLFTSFRLMQHFELKLKEAVEEGRAARFEILMQGDTSKRELIRTFSEKPRSVLLGTMSFWEGVDVPGHDLRCVVIDKLPFESPFDPVIKARLKSIQDSGQNPFMSYQVPRAVITLRQGAGRLIRSASDKGVLMICDSRLRTTHYGKVFLNSLPVMRKTTNEDKICGFLARLSAESEE